MTTPVLRSSTAPLPGRPDGTPFGQNTLQATAQDSTQIGDGVLVITWHGHGDRASTCLSIRSGYEQLVNYLHDDGTNDGSFGLAWKIADQPGAQVYQAFDSAVPTSDCRTALRVYQAGTFDASVFPLATPVSFTDGSVAPDPGAVAGLDTLRDYLIEAIAGWWCNSGTVDCIPGAPSGYGNLVSAAAAGWLELAVANKAVSGAASENPGAFTDNVDATNNRGSVACAIAIPGSLSQRRAIIGHVELEVTEGNLRRAVIGHIELEAPDPSGNARRAVIGHIELQAPDYAFPSDLTYMFHPAWARYRYQAGNPAPSTARRAIVSHIELEAPVRERRAIIGHLELEAPVASSQDMGLGAFISRPPATQDPPYTASIGRYPDVYRDNLGGSNGALWSNNNWTWIANPSLQYGYGSNWGSWLVSHPARRFFWHVGMCPWVGSAGGGTHGDALPQIVAGNRDAEWRSFADYCAVNNLLGTVQSPVYLALGWEMDGTWFSHGTGNNATKMANFKNAWRRIVDVIRARQPGNNWKFCFCPTIRAFWNFGISWAESIYPGDSYVDLIGSDFYDSGVSPSYSVPPTAQQKIDRWNSYHLVTLERQNTFATSHGKRQFWGEWALTHDKGGTSPGGDDNPLFIQGSYDWATQHDYEFVSYFNSNNSSFDHSLTSFGLVPFTNSRATFLSTFAQLPHPW